MNETKIEQDGISPILKELENIDAIKTNDDLVKHLGYMHSIGVKPFFSLFADQDEKNSEYTIAQFCQGGLGLPDRDYYLNEDEHYQNIQKFYRKLIAKIFILSGTDKNNAEQIASTIYQIEKKTCRKLYDKS